MVGYEPAKYIVWVNMNGGHMIIVTIKRPDHGPVTLNTVLNHSRQTLVRLLAEGGHKNTCLALHQDFLM